MRECRRTHFRSDTAQRYIRAPPQFQIQTRRNEDRTLSADTRLYSVWLFESRCIFLLQKRKPDKQSAVVEIVLSLFLFVEFEIICDSVGWMRAENAWIQTAGYAFRRAAGEILGDFGAEFSKTKTLGTGVRIFNGTVRAEREFPLKILFLACIQVFSVLLYSAERRSKSPQRSPNTISVYSVSKYFRTFFSPMSQINSNLHIVIVGVYASFFKE